MRARKNGGYSQRARERIEDETEYTTAEVEFMMAVDYYKRCKGKSLDCRDILIVARRLGYRKVK